ncbi:Exopolyphosphatase [Tulasnella sp. 424]|nr:Exopolyphosphatase [Tulasnella sp. 424]KAG8974858.1 Exopolyphosphatase [Tulasnella sp. 425]
MGAFADFLSQTKQQFLKDLEEKNAGKWTVVMGNEAGDLDSLASSLSYSYLASKLKNSPTIALVQSPRTDLYLRAENLHALFLANLSPANSELLCLDDISSSHPLNSSFSKFVLVDHNTLLPAYRGSGKVVGILDHHADDKNHLDAEFRELEPVGSCASLVAKHFQNEWTPEANVPREVATLLLTAITIDTGGLKPDDKATQADTDAARFLFAASTISQGSSFDGEKSLKSLAKDLHDLKADVSHLNTRDLLRRDYKEFTYGGLQVGLSTVPVGLKNWSEKEDLKKTEFFESLEEYMATRKLNVLGVLTTYKSAKKHEKRRELLFITDKDTVPKEVEHRLFDGLDADKTLELDATEKLGKPRHPKHTRVWNQLNTKATRKYVAPLVKALIEGQAPESK